MSHIHMVHGPKVHTHSVWLYWAVFAALIGLTIATVWLGQFDFGKLNIVVALTIASTKAILVLAIFMHLAFDSKFFAVVASTSLVFLSLFIGFPMIDFGTRADLDALQTNFLPRDQKVYEHHLEDPKDLPLRPGLTEADKAKLNFTPPGEH